MVIEAGNSTITLLEPMADETKAIEATAGVSPATIRILLDIVPIDALCATSSFHRSLKFVPVQVGYVWQYLSVRKDKIKKKTGTSQQEFSTGSPVSGLVEFRTVHAYSS